MIDKIAIGRRIAVIRKELGDTQSQFAERLSVSTQAVSKWETGAALPDVDILIKLSWIGNRSINQILDGDAYAFEDGSKIERGLVSTAKMMICPQCGAKLHLNTQNIEMLCFLCENGHEFSVVDGVVYFGTREIPGELWSLLFKNYDDYLLEQRHPGLPRYAEGERDYRDVMWDEIERLRPRTILDIACGTGSGIKHMIQRIHWPTTIILTDLSHRVLKWNKIFFSTEWHNPYVDMVCLACDCAKLPIADDSIDLAFSNGGFESMQNKRMDGFREAHRVLKPGASAVYNMSVVDDLSGANTQKWIELFKTIRSESDLEERVLIDFPRWIEQCERIGFSSNRSDKIYGEMPAPEGDEFPFENMVLRWMAQHVVISTK